MWCWRSARELGETDYNFYGDEDFHVPGCLIRLDIDAGQAVCNVSPSLALVGDAALTMGALLSRLRRRRAANGAMRTRRCRLAAWRALSTVEKKRIQFLNNIQRALPKAMLIAIPRKPYTPETVFFHRLRPAIGLIRRPVTALLGYALPAAIESANRRTQKTDNLHCRRRRPTIFFGGTRHRRG